MCAIGCTPTRLPAIPFGRQPPDHGVPNCADGEASFFGRAPKVLIAAADNAATGGGGNIWGTVAMFAVLFGLMYLLFIRPQSKRRREAQQMQQQLGPGDQIVTIGGLYGTV